MLSEGGYKIARVAEIPWEDRVNVDGWPSRAGMYYDDKSHNLCMRLIDYPVGSTEPRHVHPGMHATTVLKGTTEVDGLTLKPLDVIVGPSNEPHGPLYYPNGCKLFSAFQGSYFHSEVETLSSEKQYRLVQADRVPWQKRDDGCEAKTLVDRGLGTLLLEVLRFRSGTRIQQPGMLAALIVDGEAQIGTQYLGAWDFFFVSRDTVHAPITFDKGATLLALTMR